MFERTESRNVAVCLETLIKLRRKSAQNCAMKIAYWMVNMHATRAMLQARKSSAQSKQIAQFSEATEILYETFLAALSNNSTISKSAKFRK